MDQIAMDIVTKKQLNILIQLAEADKHFAKVEREMVFRIAKERNFPEDAVNEIIRNPEPIGTLGALSNDQKFEYLIECILLMFIDQKVFESEIIFCKSIAIKLVLVAGNDDNLITQLGCLRTVLEHDLLVNLHRLLEGFETSVADKPGFARYREIGVNERFVLIKHHFRLKIATLKDFSAVLPEKLIADRKIERMGFVA